MKDEMIKLTPELLEINLLRAKLKKLEKRFDQAFRDKKINKSKGIDYVDMEESDRDHVCTPACSRLSRLQYRQRHSASQYWPKDEYTHVEGIF